MAELFINPLFSDANLVSYWRMEGNSNDSKSSNNGTDTNITYNASYGKFGQGALFNGSSSKIAVGSTSAFNFSGTSPFTISCWVYLSSYPGATRQIISKFNLNIAGQWVLALIYTSPNYFFALNRNASPFTPAISNITISTGNWYHLVGVYDGTNSTIYTNGVAGTPIASGSVGSSSIQTHIGCILDNGNPTNFFPGYIDDVAIFSRALTSSEILSLYKDFKVKTNWFM